MVESNLDAVEFANSIYNTYVNYELIETRDWDNLIGKLEKKILILFIRQDNER